MAGPADALKQRRYPVGRADLADEIHVPDVDAEFEGRCCDECFEAPALQSLLGVEPFFFREAAVMGGDRFLAESIRQVPAEALRHSARVHEHQRRPVLQDQRREPVVVLLPDLVRHHRVERGPGDFDAEIQMTAVSFVDDRCRGVRHQELRDLLDRLLRRRKPEP